MRGRDFIRPPGKALAAGLAGERNQNQRHRRKCAICHHPHREAIDDDFLRWRSPVQIVNEYQLAHHSAIYRHAHATGLVARRKASVLTVLEQILERAQSAKVTASSIVNAACLYAKMTGQWKEPERKYIIERRSSEDAGPENDGARESLFSARFQSFRRADPAPTRERQAPKS
jgi:hypothetical protein